MKPLIEQSDWSETLKYGINIITVQYNTTVAPSQCAGYVFRGTQVIDIYTVHDVHENVIIIALCGLQKVVFY